MPKLTFKEEKEVRRRIWRALPYEPRRFGEIADRAKVAERTLSKYLQIWVPLKAVLHEGEFYRRNPTFDLPYDDFRESLSSGFQTVGYDFEFIKVSGLPRETKTIDDVFARIELEFSRTYYQYIRILQMIVQVPNKRAAHELFELFFMVEIEPRLSLIADFLWQNRASINIKDVEPMAALFRFQNSTISTPEGFKEAASEYTIEKLSAEYRKINKMEP